MSKKSIKSMLSIALSAAITMPCAAVPVSASAAVPDIETNVVPLIARYDAPADTTRNGWERNASQLGNGFLGAMVHGGVGINKIQINEHSVWSGGPGASESYDGGAKGDPETIKKTLLEVQKGLQELVSGFSSDPAYKAHFDDSGKLVTKNYNQYPGYGDLGNKVQSMFGEKDQFGSYQTLGDMYIANADKDDSYTNYSRSLDIDNSILTIEYDQKGVHYSSEYFISNPYNMMAVRLRADKAGALSKEISIDSIQPNKLITGDVARNTITMVGRPSDHREDIPHEEFAQQLKVVASGANAETLTMGKTVYVDDADEIIIYMTAGTNYKQATDGSYDFFYDEDPLDAVAKRIDDAVKLGYEGLRTKHVEDYKRLFDAEKVDFGARAVPEKTTDKLLAGYGGRGEDPNTADEDLYLETLYYQFGRYLLISSSRDGFENADGSKGGEDALPANLQGIWADQLTNAWNADYHTNINIQMNYWLAEQTNLAECHRPMIDYINSLVKYGENMVDHYYIQSDGETPVRGWTVGHECNIWGNAAPGESGASWFPTAAAWICQDIWEYYQFTKDEQFLADNYDTLLKAAQFWVDFLWEDERDGKLVANPSYSPEHGPFSLGATCDQGIIWEIFNEVLNAGEILGRSGDADTAEIKAAFDKLSDNLQIGLGGQFMEWKDETTIDVTGDNGHRHTNHLFVLHPGNQVVAGRSEKDDEYIEAMKKTLNTRGDGGTGWSKAWKLNFWARLRDGDHAHTMVEQLLKESTADNLFDLHPPFQIDGNFGATAGMTEMLLQSQGDAIELLPALPSAWSRGSASGIKARGNVTVDMDWSHGYLTAAQISPANSGEYKIVGKNIKLGKVVDSKGSEIRPEETDNIYVSDKTGRTANDYLVLKLEGGETYTLYGFENDEDVNDAHMALKASLDAANAELGLHPSTGGFFDEDADAAMRSMIASAQKVYDNKLSTLFDFIDAKESIDKAIEVYKQSYDVQLTLDKSDGVYKGIQEVTITCTSKLVDIKYTTDGTEPSAGSGDCDGSVYIPYGRTVLKARPFYNGAPVGETVTAEYFTITDEQLTNGATAAETSESVTINGYPVGNIADNNTSSRWATSSKKDSDLVMEITLRSETLINTLLLDEFAEEKESGSRIQSVKLEYSEGDSWKEITVNDTYLTRGKGQHYYRGICFDGVTTNKLRLTMQGNNISIFELGLYNTGKTADKTELNKLIAECEDMDSDTYNDNEGFVKALAVAKALAAASDVSQIDILKAMSDLAKAKEDMINSGIANDHSVVATFSNAQARVGYFEGKVLRSDWNKADGVANDEGIKAAGEIDNTTANPFYFFEADLKLELTDDSKDIDINDEENPIWKNVKITLRSTNDGNERRSDPLTITGLASEYITDGGSMSDFHIRVPLTAIPNRTGDKADVNINWGDVQEMKIDVEVAPEAATADKKHPYLALKVSDARITTTDPDKHWDHSGSGTNPEDGVNYTLDQLREQVNIYVDPEKYTAETYGSYENTLEAASGILESGSSQKNINRAYMSLVEARRALAEKAQENWITTFSKMNGTFSVLKPGDKQLYADWKQCDDSTVDVSENIENKRLQLTVVTQYKNADVKAGDMLSRLTVKLRSADKANVEGDPESSNKEHNYGWDISGGELGDGAELTLSIPLNRLCTNKKGVMDWTDVQRVIVTAPLKGSYAEDGTNCTMKLSSVRIVDIGPVNTGKAELKALAEKTVNLSGGSAEDTEAYERARDAALAIAESTDEAISLYDVQKAYKALEAAIESFTEGGGDGWPAALDITAQYSGTEAVYSVTASGTDPVNGTAAVAFYNENDALIKLVLKPLNGAALGVIAEGTEELAQAPAYCKAFLWESTESMKPLAESKTALF